MIFYAILLVVIAEVGLRLIVTYFRREFQWLITAEDEHPRIDPVGLKKFLAISFEPDLGWSRKPGTTGTEKGKYGHIRFTIDAQGARSTPSGGEAAPHIATFGDSYTFCRQVEDHETWQCELGRKLKAGVLNYGNGNYGVDQALLRYEKTDLPSSVRMVVLGFVPETICRIHSYWKHYLEFGNTLAFKPRFVLEDGRLALIPNIMQSEEDFHHLADKLDTIRRYDLFYRRKFRSMQFRFPYLVSFLRHPVRNFRLIFFLCIRAGARWIGKTSDRIENHPFTLIMRDNIKQAHRMYVDPRATRLLRAILLRFKEAARRRGHAPFLLVMPQRIDLELSLRRTPEYARFYRDLGEEVPVIDLTEVLRQYPLDEIFVEDSYGGHYSHKGNMIIADCLEERLRHPHTPR